MDPIAVSPRTTSNSPLAAAQRQQQQPAAPTARSSSSSPSTPVSPASGRTNALLASFAGLSPTREPTADGPTFLAQPFTPSAVLGNSRSFRPRQVKPCAPPQLPTASPSQPADSAVTSVSATKKARRRRSSVASNSKFHSQPRARRSSHTPLSARSASFALSPRTPTEFGILAPGLPSPSPPSPGMSSSDTWAIASADARPPRKSSVRQPPPAPSSSAITAAASSRPPSSKRATPRKAPPPEIFILNATPAAARLLDLQRSPSTASVQSGRSDWALSLGAFETLPVGFQLQPSPPTSPGVSPTTAGFLVGSATAGGCSRSRTSRLNSASSLSIDRQLYSPPRTPLASARRRSYTSPMRHAQLRAGNSLPAGPQLGASKVVEEKGQQRVLEARDKEQAKREKERRRMAEQARPLPYSKKVEIDEFLGNLPAKAKRTRQPGSKDVAWRGESAGRNVGSGRRTEHVTEDGNVWLDVEEEEWAWLLSEVGKGGQPLPNWPQQFTSHLRRTSDAPRGRGLGPAGGRGAELEWTIQEIIQDTAYAVDDGGLDAWLGDAPEKLVSVFNLKKDSTVRAGSLTGKSDGGGSDHSGKRRPRVLQAFGSSSSSVDRPATPPLIASLDLEALQAHGKSDFIASTFAPTSPTHSLATLPPSPISPTDEEAAMHATTRPRRNSCKSEKPAKAPKPTTGALGKMRGFLKKVGREPAAA